MGPKILPFQFSEEPLYAGETAQVQCLVTLGDLPVQIRWSFHGYALKMSSLKGLSVHKLGPKSSILTIDYATTEHSGNYTCSVSNTAGVANHTAELVVNG